jgi:hypothetical protein
VRILVFFIAETLVQSATVNFAGNVAHASTVKLESHALVPRICATNVGLQSDS